MEIVRKQKYLVLIITLVGVLLVHALSRRLIVASLVHQVLITLTLLAVFLVVFKGRRERSVALLATIATIAVTWAHQIAPADRQFTLEVAHYALHASFMGFAVMVILANVLKQKLVTGDEVLGAVCGYLLAATFWGNLYALTDVLLPGSFSMSPTFAGDLRTWDGRVSIFDYFSLVTLTTMGYGDITPVRAPATTLALLEAVFGQFYIAVLVAQLVGLRLAQAMRPDDARR